MKIQGQVSTTKYINEALGFKSYLNSVDGFKDSISNSENQGKSFNKNENPDSLNNVYKMKKSIYQNNILLQSDTNFPYKD